MYQAQNFEQLLGLPGFSDNSLITHFALYQGYVNNVNKLSDSLAVMLKEGKTASPEYAELKRRFGWEFNGMRLHEYYFGAMTKTATSLPPDSPLYQQIVKDFGSFEAWRQDFIATATLRGIGWAVLCYDALFDRLFNVWVNEHDLGHLSGGTPLLNLDVFEHAYMLDYGPKRADYLAAFLPVIDWRVVAGRFDQARIA
ncbi:superoxide dismutase [Patescibacteria group bacterium]|nr:superoxide dismutase [Patescibacteria group bacterium]